MTDRMIDNDHPLMPVIKACAKVDDFALLEQKMKQWGFKDVEYFNEATAIFAEIQLDCRLTMADFDDTDLAKIERDYELMGIVAPMVATQVKDDLEEHLAETFYASKEAYWKAHNDSVRSMIASKVSK